MTIDLGYIALIILFIIIAVSWVVFVIEKDKLYKRRYAALCKGDKFFLLDTYNGNKCIIEIKYVNPVGERYVIVESKGNEYKYSMNEFFTNVLMKTNRYYYEKLDNNSFKNIK